MLPGEFSHLAPQAMCCHLASVVAPPRLDVPAEGVTRALIALFAGKILVAIAQVTKTCFSFRLILYQNQNFHLFDPQTIYISAILT